MRFDTVYPLPSNIPWNGTEDVPIGVHVLPLMSISAASMPLIDVESRFTIVAKSSKSSAVAIT